jgi:hypothetical protein
MNCRIAREHIHCEIDNELPPALQALLAGHLNACESCRRFRSDLRTIYATMRGLGGVDEPTSKPATPLVFRHSRIIRWRSVLATAAALALCVTTWWAVRGLRVESEPVVIVAKGNGETQSVVESNASTAETDTATHVGRERPRARVSVTSKADIITVPMETHNPNVTIIWLYETSKTVSAPSRSRGESPSS